MGDARRLPSPLIRTVINAVVFAILIGIFRPKALKQVFTEGQMTLWVGGTASVAIDAGGGDAHV